MTYDEKLAERIRRALPPTSSISEKKMFGGRAHVRLMDFTGRPLTGYVYVGPAGTRTEVAVGDWVGLALQFVRSLPVKSKPKRATRSRRARSTADRRRP